MKKQKYQNKEDALIIPLRISDKKDYYFKLISVFNVFVKEKHKKLTEQEIYFIINAILLDDKLPFIKESRKLLKSNMGITEQTCANLLNRMRGKGWVSKEGKLDSTILKLIIEQNPKFITCAFMMK